MNRPEHTRKTNTLQSWYRYAAEQPWAVDAYLCLVRMHEFKTQEQQQNEFGTTAEHFLHLQAMHLPREDSFVEDALHIAQACHLDNPNAFVQAMVLASQLQQSSSISQHANQFYQAAYDAGDDLDTPHESEQE
ncbi:MAG: hypothetical protein ACYDER_03145 [Ktedonobacteraceae bacterium]